MPEQQDQPPAPPVPTLRERKQLAIEAMKQQGIKVSGGLENYVMTNESVDAEECVRMIREKNQTGYTESKCGVFRFGMKKIQQPQPTEETQPIEE